MDRRDEPTWVAVGLTHLGETRIEEASLEGALRSDLQVDSDFPIFIPARVYRKGNKTVVVYLMQGYVFVAAGLPDTTYFELERKPYVSKVMSVAGGPHRIRTLKVVPNSQVENLRRQLREQVSSDIRCGDWVTVLDGPYKSLEGRVVGGEGESIFVEVRLRSLHLIATVPLILLESSAEPDQEKRSG